MSDTFYLLSNKTNLDQVQRIIAARNIPFTLCEITSPYPSSCVMIESINLEIIKNDMGLNNVKSVFIKTNEPNLFLVHFVLDIPENDPNFKLKRDYAQLVVGRYNSEAATFQINITACEKKIADLAMQIFNENRKAYDERIKLRHLNQYAVETTTKLLEDLDRMIKENEIEEIKIEDGVLIVQTTPIILRHENTDINLGRYTITLSPSSNLPIIGATSHNQIRKIDKMDYIHPLIPVSGSVNFGRLIPTFSQLLGEWNFAEALRLMINYLKNLDESGRRILIHWARGRS